jgi:hypothetical protein
VTGPYQRPPSRQQHQRLNTHDHSYHFNGCGPPTSNPSKTRTITSKYSHPLVGLPLSKHQSAQFLGSAVHSTIQPAQFLGSAVLTKIIRLTGPSPIPSTSTHQRPPSRQQHLQICASSVGTSKIERVDFQNCWCMSLYPFLRATASLYVCTPTYALHLCCMLQFVRSTALLVPGSQTRDVSPRTLQCLPLLVHRSLRTTACLYVCTPTPIHTHTHTHTSRQQHQRNTSTTTSHDHSHYVNGCGPPHFKPIEDL